MGEMSLRKWAAIGEYQRGARSSGRGGWRHPSGNRCHSSPRGEAHSSAAFERPIGESCWSCSSTDHKKNKRPTREVKATEDGREEAWSVRGSCAEWYLSAGYKLWRGCASRDRDTGACGSDSLAAAAVATTCVQHTTRGRLELARCKSLRCRRKRRRRMHQRVLRGLKQQVQRLGAGCGYLLMTRPRWMEAQLRRRREVP